MTTAPGVVLEPPAAGRPDRLPDRAGGRSAAPGSVGATRAVAFWKVAEYAGLISFTILAPRLMGPAGYGSFAALLSLVGLLTVASTLGGHATLGRFVPEFELRAERERTRLLFTRIFALRVLASTTLALLFLFLYPRIAPEASRSMVLYGAGAILCAALGSTCYQLFYGLNALGRWMTHDGLARGLLLGLLLLPQGGPGPAQAVRALFLTELSLLLLGLFWARGYFTTARDASGGGSILLGQLRFGLLLFLANLGLMTVWRGGETALLLLSGTPAEVAYYSVASAITLALTVLVAQLASIITPTVTAFHFAGESDRRDAWLGQSLKWLTIACFVVLFVVYGASGDATGLLLGPEYAPVASNLRILVLALLPVAFIRTGMSLSVIHTQPGRSVQVAAIGLAVFVLASVVLIPVFHSSGASWAVVAAAAASGATTYFRFSMAPLLELASFWRVIGLGALAFTLCFLPGGEILSAAAGLITFLALLLWRGAVTLPELRRLAHVLGK